MHNNVTSTQYDTQYNNNVNIFNKVVIVRSQICKIMITYNILLNAEKYASKLG